jgi:hypothetical protein
MANGASAKLGATRIREPAVLTRARKQKAKTAEQPGVNLFAKHRRRAAPAFALSEMLGSAAGDVRPAGLGSRAAAG